MGNENIDRFRNLTYEDFKKMASDTSLAPHEKIGFPAVFRQGYDSAILEDIKLKLQNIQKPGTTIADIGCGCGELTSLLIEHCRKNKQKLILIDSDEVLRQIPDHDNVFKAPGKFPHAVTALRRLGSPDALICYSVFHYLYAEGTIFDFLDNALDWLAPSGELLVGDIPNVSKRNRFLQSPAGEAFHRKLMNTSEKPQVVVGAFEAGKIDDGVLLGIIMRYRNFGFETYLLPQPDALPLSNSRDDLLFRKLK